MLQQLQVGMEERQTKTWTRTNPELDLDQPGRRPTRTRTRTNPDHPGIPDQKGWFISGGRVTQEARSARGQFTGLGHRAGLARGPVVNQGPVYPKKRAGLGLVQASS